MSTGLECWFIEWRPAEWYLVLEDYPGTKCGDWLDAATAEGPFRTEQAALEYLRSAHANPGGYGTRPYMSPPPTTGRWATIINRARAPRRLAW